MTLLVCAPTTWDFHSGFQEVLIVESASSPGIRSRMGKFAVIVGKSISSAIIPIIPTQNFHLTTRRGTFARSAASYENGDMCYYCWVKHYIRYHAYKSNPELSFKYSERYLCMKCYNTGYRIKNGTSCKNCWEGYGPRNDLQSVGNTMLPSLEFITTVMPLAALLDLSNPIPTVVKPGDPKTGGI
ncbi:uncharacterized protein CANTADRAFT_22697 [Suhomyces tanzawaensis NRRL Y-17324]|uniref:Uncharacterized protein n=1 Tax=Suhomyces tanzawaensis NRRL Y-17324 TaxID=984487 RepID=A0A1E4SH38_9ASCO|nr:uncharacterized protein CANTADRAFT_22697 [Suhomyces tanzawaensis NRRL Y-17324]ODV78732.1 hypothetical protein CANTADRAFT_22697 [Suhomyces tanzawaensis NRRL Y-17324]